MLAKFSSSYLRRVKEGFVNFFNGFSTNEDRIMSFLHGDNNNSGISTLETKISMGGDGPYPDDIPVLDRSVDARASKPDDSHPRKDSTGSDNSTPNLSSGRAPLELESGSLPFDKSQPKIDSFLKDIDLTLYILNPFNSDDSSAEKVSAT